MTSSLCLLIFTGAPSSNAEVADNALQIQGAASYSSVKKEDKNVITFYQALEETYIKNPALEAARAALRAVDESYAQAVSGFRPSVNGTTSYVSTKSDGDVTDTHGDAKTLSLEVTQPLYRGGSTLAKTNKSDNDIKAQRALLHVKEQDTLLAATEAFMDVLRDEEIVRLNLSNEKVLTNHLDASRERFKLGDITRTDVSQAESRLADAVATRITAEGNLKRSRAAFEKTIGLPAIGTLEAPKVHLPLPATLEEAIAEGERNNPSILYAQYLDAAANASTRAIVGELLPQVDLSGAVGRTYDAGSGDDNRDTGTLTLRATIPFYSGGDTYSRIRQSRQVEAQRRLEIRESERAARQSVIDAWEGLASARAESDARKSQIEAARLALEGVKVESEYGSRTTLDLLDAEYEYLNAQVALVIAERNRVVAAYELFATLGHMTAKGLGLGVNEYVPEANFQKVRNQWFGSKIQEDNQEN